MVLIFSLALLLAALSINAAIGLRMSMRAGGKKTAAILGASGYTGAELMRILSGHPNIEVKVLTADRSAGQEFKSIYPQYAYRSDLPKLTKWEDSKADIEKCDVAFCCLPHGTTQEIINELAKTPTVKIVDLSADFRLRDIDSYAQWYGKAHAAPHLQKEAVYGLTELNRAAVKDARILANPGCYPTAAQLPLIPLLRAGLISGDDIIIDAKSGTTGAGRAPKEVLILYLSLIPS
jgi:N-acetyl-gamma-glutamyl-phosphate reductase